MQSESYADAMRSPHVSLLSNATLAEKNFTMFTPWLAIFYLATHVTNLRT
jgi:hypothetical protein